MISDMNRHIPVSRRTLLEHIESGDFTYRARNGHVCSFDKEELETIAGSCTEIEKMRLRLPIFVSTDISSEGAWKVDGMTETAVVSKLLGRKPLREDMLRIYHADLKELRKKISNAVIILYLP